MIVQEVHDTHDGLSIHLSLKNGEATVKVKIVFDPYVAYRNMDESCRASTVRDHPGGFSETLQVVSDSRFLNWFHSESSGIYDDRDIKHYAVVTDADWIDVLAEFPPTVSVN